MAPLAPIGPTPPLAPGAFAGPVQGGANLTAGMLQLSQAGAAAAGAQAAPLASFQEFFADAVKRTSELQAQAEDKQRQLLVGETDNLHDVMIAMEKANLAFRMTLAVRNKVIDAYQEVMRMSV